MAQNNKAAMKKAVTVIIFLSSLLAALADAPRFNPDMELAKMADTYRRNEVVADSTSVASLLAYFEENYECDALMKLNFFTACHDRAGGRYVAAMDRLLLAKNLAEGTTDPYWAVQIDNLTNAVCRESIAAGQGGDVMSFLRSHYSKALAESDSSNSRYHYTMLVMALLLIATIYFGVLTHRLRISKKEMEAENLMSQLAALEDERDCRLSQLSSANAELHDQVESLFSGHYATINRLCDEYFEKADSERVRLSLYKSVEDEIARFRSPANLRKIEETVNRYLDGAIDRLREQLPKLKPTDITFIALIAAGLSPRSVCLLCDISLKNFYAKRSRLRERIANSEAPDRDTFAAMLGKK